MRQTRLTAPPQSFAFTLTELLVVVGVISLLAALLLPGLARSQDTARSASCINNLKHLQLAYRSYADDHNDALPPNISRRDGFYQMNMTGSWVVGNTFLDTSTTNLKAGLLYSYLDSPGVYRCPADKSTVRDSTLLRTRSYSISLWLNADIENFTNADQIKDLDDNVRKLSQLHSPQSVWVFIDEHEKSIDDGIFQIASWTSSDSLENTAWSSYRADRHRNAANLSFADGHVDHYQWKCARDFPAYSQGWTPILNSNDLSDLLRLNAGLPINN